MALDLSTIPAQYNDVRTFSITERDIFSFIPAIQTLKEKAGVFVDIHSGVTHLEPDHLRILVKELKGDSKPAVRDFIDYAEEAISRGETVVAQGDPSH